MTKERYLEIKDELETAYSCLKYSQSAEEYSSWERTIETLERELETL